MNASKQGVQFGAIEAVDGGGQKSTIEAWLYLFYGSLVLLSIFDVSFLSFHGKSSQVDE